MTLVAELIGRIVTGLSSIGCYYFFMNEVLFWKVKRAYLFFAIPFALLTAICETMYNCQIEYGTIWVLLMIIGEIACLIGSFVFTEGKFIKKLVVSIMANEIVAMLFECFDLSNRFILSQSEEDAPVWIQIVLPIVGAVLTCFVMFLTSLPGRNTNRRRIGVLPVFVVFIIVVFAEVTVGIFIPVVPSMIDLFRFEVTTTGLLRIISEFGAIFYLLEFIVIAITVYGLSFFMSQRYYKTSAESNASYLETQAQYYESLDKNSQEIRSLRHDYKNHLTVLALLLENGDVEKAKSYIEDISGSLNAASPVVHSGNPIADAILTDKITRAQSMNIKITSEGLFSYNDMKPVDICSILGNILDNAIEAVSAGDHKKSSKKSFATTPLSSTDINLEFKKTDSFFIISETNLSKTPLHYDGSIIMTTKSNKSLHGIGISNIKSSVEHYGGDVEITSTPSKENDGEYVFTITIMIPFVIE